MDHIPTTLDTAPGNITFQPGQLAIEFASMEQLAGALLALAEILDNAQQFAAFEDRYVPHLAEANHGQKERADVQRLFGELEAMQPEPREKTG